MKLDQDGMEKPCKDKIEKYLKTMQLMESVTRRNQLATDLYIREVLTEERLSGRTIEGVLELLDGYANNTWIFFDTETTGLHPKSAQLTEIGAIAVDPKAWNSDATILGQFNKKIKLTSSTKRLLDDPESEERLAWEEGNAGARNPLKEPQDILAMTRYGEKDRAYGDEQEVLDEFFDFVESFPNPLMIAQNAAFDLRMLNVRSTEKLPKYPVLDTQQIMKHYLLPLLKTQTRAEEGNEKAQELLDKLYVKKGNWGYHSISMGVVSKAYGISIDDWHNALADVKMMMEMYKSVVETIRRGMTTDISKEQEKLLVQKHKKKRS